MQLIEFIGNVLAFFYTSLLILFDVLFGSPTPISSVASFPFRK